MKVAAIQMDLAWEQPDRNYQRAGAAIADAAQRGAILAVLPEMFATGFSMAAAATAEPVDGRTHRFLSETARRHRIHLIATASVNRDGRPQNVALHYGPRGEQLAFQPKIHPFSFAGEDRHFAPGSALVISAVHDFHVGLAVCYDLRFPELFRALAFRGATLLVVPANWPVERVGVWRHLLVARAIENQCFVIGVNRVGQGGDLSYNGYSAIVDPLGAVLGTARDNEAVLCVDIDPGLLTRVRMDFPFLRDARTDLFPCLWDPADPDRG